MKTEFNSLDVVMSPTFPGHFLGETTESYTTDEAYDNNEAWDDDNYSQEDVEYTTEYHTDRPTERPTKANEDTTHSKTTLPPKTEAATTKGSQNKVTTKAESQATQNDGYDVEKNTTEKQQETHYQNYSQYNEYEVNVTTGSVVAYGASGMPEVTEEYATSEAYVAYDGTEDTYTTDQYAGGTSSFFVLGLIFVVVLVVAALATTIAVLINGNKKKADNPNTTNTPNYPKPTNYPNQAQSDDSSELYGETAACYGQNINTVGQAQDYNDPWATPDYSEYPNDDTKPDEYNQQ